MKCLNNFPLFLIAIIKIYNDVPKYDIMIYTYIFYILYAVIEILRYICCYLTYRDLKRTLPKFLMAKLYELSVIGEL